MNKAGRHLSPGAFLGVSVQTTGRPPTGAANHGRWLPPFLVYAAYPERGSGGLLKRTRPLPARLLLIHLHGQAAGGGLLKLRPGDRTMVRMYWPLPAGPGRLCFYTLGGRGG